MKKTVDMFAAFFRDGYLYGATDDPRGAHSKYWLSLNLDGEHYQIHKLAKVPVELAEQLLKQGTSEQVFDDGYDAASKAIKYANKKPLYAFDPAS